MLFACGSKKEFTKIDSVESVKSTEQLYAELYRTTRLLEFLDIKYRQVETRDTAGNVRIETNMEVSKKTEENMRDSTSITGNKQGNEVKILNLESSEERIGVVKYWVWIVGFVSIIIIALVIGIHVIKR